MNNVYLRSNHSVKSITKYLILSLLPLIIAGFYKNGIKLYTSDLVNIYGLFKPLLLSLSGFLIGALVNYLYERFIKKNRGKFFDLVFSSFHPVNGLLTSAIISINTNIFLFIIVTFIIFFLSKFIKKSKVNIASFAALIIIFIINLTDSFTFLNVYEVTRSFSLTPLDYLIGRGSGGVHATYGVLLIISLVILATQSFYKKTIPLFSSIAFITCLIGYGIFKNEPSLIFDNLFSNSIFFSYIYLATDPLSSSYTRIGKFVYAALIGILTFCFLLIEPSLAVFGAVLIAGLLHEIIDKLSLK